MLLLLLLLLLLLVLPCLDDVRLGYPPNDVEGLYPLDSLANADGWLEAQVSWRKGIWSKYNIGNAGSTPAYKLDDTNKKSFSAPQVRPSDTGTCTYIHTLYIHTYIR